MFWRLDLVTFSRLATVAKIACFVQNWLVFKTFQFSLEHFWLFIIFLTWNTLKLTVLLLKNLHFLHYFNSKSSRKRYGFSLSLFILHVLSFDYLNLWVVGLIWNICCFNDGLDVCLLCLDFWVLLIRLLGLYFVALLVDIDWVCLLIFFGVWIFIPILLWLFLV